MMDDELDERTREALRGYRVCAVAIRAAAGHPILSSHRA